MGRPALDPEERARRKREKNRKYYESHRDQLNEKAREYYRTYSQQDGYKEKRALRYEAEKRKMIADMMGL